jgi:hypothetical protein
MVESVRVAAMNSRAVILKVAEDQMDDCARCTVSITSDADERWVVSNVYEDCCLIPSCKRCHGTTRRWGHLEHHHEDCYDLAGQPHGPPQAPQKKTKTKPVREIEDWEIE